MNRFTDRVAVVTGATGGIGTSICTRLANEGAIVVVTDLDQSACDKAADALRGQGGRAEAHQLDVTDAEGWRALAATLLETHGAPHVLVNNAGTGSLTTVEDETDETWNHTVDVCQRGVWLGMQHMGTPMAEAGRGAIVNISSIWGHSGGFGTHFSYHGAKGAVRSLSRSAAVHWGSRGVRVNCILPGFIATAASDALWKDHPRRRGLLPGLGRRVLRDRAGAVRRRGLHGPVAPWDSTRPRRRDGELTQVTSQAAGGVYRGS